MQQPKKRQESSRPKGMGNYDFNKEYRIMNNLTPYCYNRNEHEKCTNSACECPCHRDGGAGDRAKIKDHPPVLSGSIALEV